MKRKSPLQDGWVCPNCGQTGSRHGRGGARGCKCETQGPTCPGLVCRCTDGLCFSRATGYGWRRSPCPDAFCQHCGWEGSLRSPEFERAYGSSRCPNSVTGWHWATVGPDKNKNRADKCQLTFKCKICGALGSIMIDPISDIPWQLPERKAPSNSVKAGSPEGEIPEPIDASKGVGR